MAGTYEVDPEVPRVQISEGSCWGRKIVLGQYHSVLHVPLVVVTVKLAHELGWNL